MEHVHYSSRKGETGEEENEKRRSSRVVAHGKIGKGEKRSPLHEHIETVCVASSRLSRFRGNGTQERDLLRHADMSYIHKFIIK